MFNRQRIISRMENRRTICRSRGAFYWLWTSPTTPIASVSGMWARC